MKSGPDKQLQLRLLAGLGRARIATLECCLEAVSQALRAAHLHGEWENPELSFYANDVEPSSVFRLIADVESCPCQWRLRPNARLPTRLNERPLYLESCPICRAGSTDRCGSTEPEELRISSVMPSRFSIGA
jgi:hypothetical protein